MNVDQQRFSEFFLKLILIALIITPPIKVLGSLPAIRVDELLLLVWACSSILLWRGKGMSVYVPMLLPLIVFFAIIPASILNGMWSGFSVGLGDLNQLIRLVKYVLILLLAWQVISRADKKYMDSFLGLMVLLLLILSIITLAQHFNILGINSILIPYVATEKYYNLMLNEGSMRPVGFIGNPNALGFQLCFLMLCTMYVCIYQQYKTRLFLIVVAIGFFAILSTLSRTALLAFIVGAVCMLGSATYGALRQAKISKKSFAMSGGLAVLLIGMFSFFLTSDFLYERIVWRFVGGVDVQTDTSFQARLDNWEESYEVILDVPLLGAGPLRRAHFEHAADNEYLLVLRSYGVVGLCALLFFYFSSVYKVRGGGAKLNIPIVLAASMMMIPASVFFDAAVFPLVIIFLIIGREYNESSASSACYVSS